MKLYDDKLYEFISKKENFEPYVELYEQYEKVKIRLVNEFWDEVLSFVRSLPLHDGRWTPELDPPLVGNRKLKMKHPDITKGDQFRAGIVFEHVESTLFLGAWFNRNLLNDYDKDFIQICETASKEVKNNQGWKYGTGGWWFAIYRDTGYDFKKKDTLMQILPEERTSLVQTLANDMVDTVNQFGDFCISQVNKTQWG